MYLFAFTKTTAWKDILTIKNNEAGGYYKLDEILYWYKLIWL